MRLLDPMLCRHTYINIVQLRWVTRGLVRSFVLPNLNNSAHLLNYYFFILINYYYYQTPSEARGLRYQKSYGSQGIARLFACLFACLFVCLSGHHSETSGGILTKPFFLSRYAPWGGLRRFLFLGVAPGVSWGRIWGHFRP